MIDISNFLQKFLNLEKNNKAKLAAILDVIKKETKIDLIKEDIEIKGDSLRINCNPVFKNEIFMHKEAIENELKKLKIFLKVF